MTNLIGQFIGRYHILEQLGEGGMATVYKAYDTRLERDVAVKVIRVDQFIPASIQRVLARFEREAKALGRLNHPNIVSVIDYGEHEGVPYLVMIYLPGGTLKQKMGRPMAWNQAVRLLLPIAQALGYAHSEGIIHRDVKPSNILITRSGEPMLTDFGIAKLLDPTEAQTLTGTGVGIGTPEYMAPEQGMGHAVDRRADVYSLGIVFYELVTGRKPYVADTPLAVIFKHLTDPLPRPTQYVQDLPEAVEKVLFKSLAKNPEDRYTDMGEFARALEKLLESPQPARVKPPSEERESERREEIPTGAMTDTQKTIDEMPFTPPAEKGSQTTPMGQSLEGPEPPARSALSEYYRYSLRTFKNLSVGQKKAVWSGLIALALVITGLVIFISVQSFNKGPATFIYFTSDRLGTIEVFDTTLDGAVQRYTSSPAGYKSWDPAPTLDGSTYFASNRSGKTEIWRVGPNGTEQVTRTPGNYESWSPAPTVGGYVYFASNRSGKTEVWRVGPNGAEQVTRTSGNYESWSPAPTVGGYVYFASNRSGKTEVWRVGSNGAEQVTRTPGNYESWSPAPTVGGYVYFASNRSGKTEVWRVGPNGSKQVTQTPGGSNSWGPRLTLFGYLYFSSDPGGQTDVFGLDTNGTPARLGNTPANHNSWTTLESDKFPKP